MSHPSLYITDKQDITKSVKTTSIEINMPIIISFHLISLRKIDERKNVF